MKNHQAWGKWGKCYEGSKELLCEIRGYESSWFALCRGSGTMDDGGGICCVVRVVHRIDDIVMAAMDHVRFLIPVPAGTVVEFWAGITGCGSTSLKMHVEGKDILDREKVYCSADVIFVNVDHEGKKTPHRLSLEQLKPEEENY